MKKTNSRITLTLFIALGIILTIIGMSIYQMENFLNGDLDEMIDNLIAADRAEKLKGEED